MPEARVDFLLGPDELSKIIAWYGNGPNGYSHAASLLADGRYVDARDDVIAGVPAGVHYRDPATEAWVRRQRCVLEVTQGEYEDWEGNLVAKIGDAYAERDIEGYLLSRMMHRVGTYDCSALLINALQHIKKVVFPLPIPAHQITPNAALLLVAQAGFILLPEETHG